MIYYIYKDNQDSSNLAASKSAFSKSTASMQALTLDNSNLSTQVELLKIGKTALLAEDGKLTDNNKTLAANLASIQQTTTTSSALLTNLRSQLVSELSSLGVTATEAESTIALAETIYNDTTSENKSLQSQLVTKLTSIGIPPAAGSTIAQLITSLSTQYETTKTNLDLLTQANTNLQTQLTTSKAETGTAKGQLTTAEASVSASSLSAVTLQAQLTASETSNTSLSSQLNTLTTAASAYSTSISALKAKYNALVTLIGPRLLATSYDPSLCISQGDFGQLFLQPCSASSKFLVYPEKIQNNVGACMSFNAGTDVRTTGCNAEDPQQGVSLDSSGRITNGQGLCLVPGNFTNAPGKLLQSYACGADGHMKFNQV